MSTQQVTQQAKHAAGETAGTAKDEAAQTAQTARDAAGATAQTARDEASHVGSTAASAASDVVDTTKEQVSHVAGEALDQVRALTDQVRGQFSEQAGAAAQKLAQAVRSLADELHQMSNHQGDNHGAASQAAHQLSERGHRFADYLEQRDPESVVADLRGSAARRPGGFLLGAVVAGVLTGRLVRGGRAAAANGPAAAPVTTEVGNGYVPVPVSSPPIYQSTYESTYTSAMPEQPVQGGSASFSMPVATPGAESVVQSVGTPYPEDSAAPRNGSGGYDRPFVDDSDTELR